MDDDTHTRQKPDSLASAQVPTVAEALQRVVRRHFLAEHRSAKDVEWNVRKYLLAQWGALRLTDLTSEDIEAYAASLRGRPLAPATVNLILHPLRTAFKLYAPALEARGVRPPDILRLRVRNAREVCFERPAFERVVAELPALLRPPAWFMYFTGWRWRSEVLRLRWDVNVRADAGMVVLPANATKGGRNRGFPFGLLPELETILREQRARAAMIDPPPPWVFFRYGGRRIVNGYAAWHAAVCRAFCGYDEERSAKPGWRRRRPRCGCKDARRCRCQRRIPHDLRRTAARNLRNEGVPDSVIMELVGWSSVNMLYRYLGRAPEHQLREAVMRLARGLEKRR